MVPPARMKVECIMPRFVLAQINTTVGDLEGNARRVLSALEQAQAYAPDLVIFPEMTLTGYPPEDLLLKPGFLEASERVMQDLARQVKGNTLIGYPSHPLYASHPNQLPQLPKLKDTDRPHNTALLVSDGRIVADFHKCLLPNYAVFDEKRYFAEGGRALNIDLRGADGATLRLGVVICEDAWEDFGPAKDSAAAGAQAILCLSASPFHRTKEQERIQAFSRLCNGNNVYFLYCNLVGGQDELIFDGASFVMNPQGEIIRKAKTCEEDFLVFDLPADLPAQNAARQDPALKTLAPVRPMDTVALAAHPAAQRPAVAAAAVEPYHELAAVYAALVLGVRDYVRKNGFAGVLIGLSGGIDSALTAAIAVDALGPDNVFGVTMPSRYSSGETKDDARILAENLGIRFESLPIEGPFAAFEEVLTPVYAGADPAKDPENLTGQNLQARIRGVYLMALSNKYGLLLLNTTNKSESAAGYGTLYGDMCGGYAAIKDVLKTEVWKLSYYVNELHGREVIPVTTIVRVPSAELRENQEDRQSLPDYPLLDPILSLYVEQDMTFDEIVAAGHDRELVRRIVRLVDRSEFKRRQSVFGPRVSPKAFGKDRRLPVTNRFVPK